MPAIAHRLAAGLDSIWNLEIVHDHVLTAYQYTSMYRIRMSAPALEAARRCAVAGYRPHRAVSGSGAAPWGVLTVNSCRLP